MAPHGSANGEALLLSVQKGVPVSSITVNYGCKSLDGVPILITICKYGQLPVSHCQLEWPVRAL